MPLVRLARSFAGLIHAVTLCLSAADACAEPPRQGTPLRILVGFTAGGTTDLLARILAEPLAEALGRPVIVENRPGASGRVAAMALRTAPRDGRTVMIAPMVVTVLAPMVWKNLEYDPARDFAPVAQLATYAIALAVRPGLPVGTLEELTAWARANPAHATYGVAAAGSLTHLFGVNYARETGVPWITVPYSGLPPLAADLSAGRITASFEALSNLVELHRGGKARILAVSGEQRSPLLPDVPTFKEQGFPGISGTSWFAMYAPAGTPAATIDAISTAVGEALRQPAIRERLLRVACEPTGTSAAALSRISAREAAYWAGIVQSTRFAEEQ